MQINIMIYVQMKLNIVTVEKQGVNAKKFLTLNMFCNILGGKDS